MAMLTGHRKSNTLQFLSKAIYVGLLPDAHYQKNQQITHCLITFLHSFIMIKHLTTHSFCIDESLSHTRRVELALDYYARDYLPTLTDMADLFKVSDSTLKRSLREEGATYHDILNRQLIKRAEHLLIYSNKSIRVISESLGYANAANFRRAFKRWKGVSPKMYRDLLRLDPHKERTWEDHLE